MLILLNSILIYIGSLLLYITLSIEVHSTMPPKKKEAKQSPDLSLVGDSIDSTLPSIHAFKYMLDSRLNMQEKKIEAQIKDLNVVVRKQHKKSQEEMLLIQNSQNFIGAKFDELLAAVNSLKEKNKQFSTDCFPLLMSLLQLIVHRLSAENVKLNYEMNQMSSKILELEEAQEDLKLYSRRDCLEFRSMAYPKCQVRILMSWLLKCVS